MNKINLERVLIIVGVLIALAIIITQLMLRKRRMELRERADLLSEVIEDVSKKIDADKEKEVSDSIIQSEKAETWQEYHKKISKPVTWNFLENQPNWILKPSPDHNEKTANGLNIRIAPSSSTAIQNTKDSWSSDIFKTIHIQIGPVFEKLDIEITLKNEAGETFIINGAEKLKEGINSIRLKSDTNPIGEIKDTEIRFYNKESRNLSSFSLIAIQLTP